MKLCLITYELFGVRIYACTNIDKRDFNKNNLFSCNKNTALVDIKNEKIFTCFSTGFLKDMLRKLGLLL
jgi:hypothetical protein